MITNKEISWAEIVESYTSNPRDVQTVPVTNKKGIWFYVHVENENVYITDAEYHKDSSKISNPIRLQQAKFSKMLDLYLQRRTGNEVSHEAKNTSFQQVYWYGIFADMGI